MPGAVIVAAPGPSLVHAHLERFRLPDVLAVTSAFLAVPHASHVYACDRKFWDEYAGQIRARHPGAQLWAAADGRAHHAGVNTVDLADVPASRGSYAPAPDFCSEPGKIHSGRNSGYQAMNLAKLLGYSLLLLVGFDMRKVDEKQHFFGEYSSVKLRRDSPYRDWIPHFRTVTTSADFRIVNCTPGSAIDAFPMGRLEDFLEVAAVPSSAAASPRSRELSPPLGPRSAGVLS